MDVTLEGGSQCKPLPKRRLQEQQARLQPGHSSLGAEGGLSEEVLPVRTHAGGKWGGEEAGQRGAAKGHPS